MLCDKINVPKFTDEQIAKCRVCKHASKKCRDFGRGWCCKLGAWIEKTSPIIQQAKQPIILPSRLQLAKNFTRAAGRYLASGMKTRSENEQKKLQAICRKCDFYLEDSAIGPRCRKCGCNMNVKIRWATTNCPINKW